MTFYTLISPKTHCKQEDINLLSVLHNEQEKKTEIMPGMSSKEIASIISDRLVELVLKNLKISVK